MYIYIRFFGKKPGEMMYNVTNLNVRDGKIIQHPQLGEFKLLKLFLIRNGNYEEYDDILDVEVF